MASFSSSLTLYLSIFLLLLGIASARLSTNFYSSSCPSALSIIEGAISSAISSENRMGASLLRLHFHDCFVNGCDASVLLDDTSNFKGEKTAGPNDGSLRGYEVIDSIKTQLEKQCPGVVSCADILAVAARDSVVALGGTRWNVPLGRRDATTASFDAAESNLPSPFLDLGDLISAFSNKGFTAQELVVLSGGHTIGQARCLTFRTRLYDNTENIDAAFASSLKKNCPSSGGDDNLSPLDESAGSFDNTYFKNLVDKKGIFHSDQQLFGNNGSTDSIVNSYSLDSGKFFTDFAKAMTKMGNLSPLTGSNGEIRTNCRKINGS